MSDISINYKGSSIATMDASGSKTLLTSGKYCEDNLEVVYSKPSGESGYTLVDSGTYTVASDTTSSVTIPITTTASYQDYKIKVVVVKDILDSTNQMSWFSANYDKEPSDYYQTVGINTPKAACVNSSGEIAKYVCYPENSTASAIVGYSGSSQNIIIRPYNSTYKIKAGNYHWYVWKGDAYNV